MAHHVYSVKNVGVLVNGMTPSQEKEQSLSSLSEMLTDLQYFIRGNNNILSETTKDLKAFHDLEPKIFGNHTNVIYISTVGRF